MAFKGIAGLRADDEVIKYETWMIDEVLKCSEDPIYFIKNYVYINTKDHGMQKFDLYDYQIDFILSLIDNRFIVAKWPRQCGKSATTLAYLLWYANFHSDKTIAVLANKLSLAQEQLMRIKESYIMLPEWMQIGVAGWAKRGIALGNNTKIICAATSPDGIRGLAINILYLDEFAFVPPHIADEFIASVFPTVSSGKTTKIVITSTPNGMNHFFKMWDSAERKDSSFVPKQIAWDAPPGRDLDWAHEQIRNIGEIRFNQEFKCDFLGSQSTLIDHVFLAKMIKATLKPLKIPNLPELVKVWQLPLSKEVLKAKGWEYVACLDSAMGLYQDNTVLQICLVKNNINVHQVAKMSSNKIQIEEFCEKSMSLLKSYHMPTLIIEQNGPGIAAMGYYHTTAEYENLVHFDPKGNRLGLWTTDKLKEIGCILLKSYIQKKLLKIYDYETVNELTSFGQRTKSKWEGLGGNHDDHVMSLIWIPYFLMSPMFYGNIVEQDILKIADDASIILSQDDAIKRLIASSSIKSPDFHKEELERAIEYSKIIEETDENGQNRRVPLLDDRGEAIPGEFEESGGSGAGIIFKV